MDELADNLLPHRCLVCAIVTQAVRDCGKGETREEALRWLQARETLEWCDAWEVDLERIKRFVNSNTVQCTKMA